MTSRLASVRGDGGLDRVDRAVQLLEEEWRRHGEVPLENFWAEQRRGGPAGPVDSLSLLAALVKADLRVRFDQGQTPTAAGYLDRFPELRGSDSHMLSLVYEEFCLSEERGNGLDVDSFCDRYPELKSSLASQLRCHRLISQAAGLNPTLPRFPKLGEDFEEFHLISLLGRGGTSRVFLASDLSLGGKQVALKVTLDRGQEPKVQGALDHPHIVPVNSVVYQTDGRLCGLSMPFRPGLPLDEIIRRVKPAERPCKAMALWDVLHDGTVPGSTSDAQPLSERIDDKGGSRRLGPRGDGWEGFPAHGTYAQGVAWIVQILARALQYAHGKLTYHRDVKPANMLLTIMNGPQLLDFNLAESPHSADNAQAALHGGTLPYMAPEQIEAFLNPELWGKVGARADVYSLGLVLRELLTGQVPELPDDTLPAPRAMQDLLDRRPFLDVAVRRLNPAIPHALEAIVAKCLELSPDDRYPGAESLAEDLARFLKHQPLLKAANPPWRERVSNWLRRNRELLKGAACVVVLLVFASGVLVSGVLLSRALNERSKHWVETSPRFLSAMRDVDQGEFQRAFGPLSKLVVQDPHSCLIKFYLSLTLDNLALNNEDQKKDDAQEYLEEALAVPDAESTLVAWAKVHPSVTLQLVDFADETIKRVDQFAEGYDVDNPKDDELRDKLLRRRSYKLAGNALALAEKLDPKSQRIQRLLAKTEEISGDYASAHSRLRRLIDSTDSSSDSSMDTLFFCRRLRGRVAILWVESLRHEGVRLDKEILGRLEEANLDLDKCAGYLRSRRFSLDQALKVYHVLHDRVRATLNLAELEIELAVPPAGDERLRAKANGHLKKARKIITELTEHSQSNGLKFRPPTRLTKRLDDALRQLGTARGVVSGRSQDRVPSQPAGAGTHLG